VTIQGYVRTYKAFASWLFEEDYTDQNILQRYRMPKARKSVPEWLRQDEIERLLGKFDRKTAVGARDYAVVVTFLDTGLRCSELCGLTLAGANLDVGELKVIGKGDRNGPFPWRQGGSPSGATAITSGRRSSGRSSS
jgi:integrase/recombinase XerD